MRLVQIMFRYYSDILNILKHWCPSLAPNGTHAIYIVSQLVINLEACRWLTSKSRLRVQLYNFRVLY